MPSSTTAVLKRVAIGVVYVPLSVLIIIPLIFAIGVLYAVVHIPYTLATGDSSGRAPVVGGLWSAFWNGWHWNQSNLLYLLGLGGEGFKAIPQKGHGRVL